MNAVCIALVNIVRQALTSDSWIFDTGASFHTCNDWSLMEDIVTGEPRTAIASTGEKQIGDLFGKVRLVWETNNNIERCHVYSGIALQPS
jgi:hypothetical protein